MTSLLRELVAVPIVPSASRTITSRPASASDLATARPATPAPITTESTRSAGMGGHACAILRVQPDGDQQGSHYPSDSIDGRSRKTAGSACRRLERDRARPPLGGGDCPHGAARRIPAYRVRETSRRQPFSAGSISGSHRAVPRGVPEGAHRGGGLSPRSLPSGGRRPQDRIRGPGAGGAGISADGAGAQSAGNFAGAAIQASRGARSFRLRHGAFSPGRRGAQQHGQRAVRARPLRGGGYLLPKSAGHRPRPRQRPYQPGARLPRPIPVRRGDRVLPEGSCDSARIGRNAYEYRPHSTKAKAPGGSDCFSSQGDRPQTRSGPRAPQFGIYSPESEAS